MSSLINSSDSDSDLENLLQLSDWDSEDDVLHKNRPCHVDVSAESCRRGLDDDDLQRSPSPPNHELEQHDPSCSDEELVEHVPPLFEEELALPSPLPLEDDTHRISSHLQDDLVPEQNANDSEILLSPPHTSEESVQPQSFVVRRRRISRRHRKVEKMQYLNDAEFRFRFRLSKSAVEALLTEIMPYVQVTSKRNHGVAPLHRLLLTLRFYALGTMLISVAHFVGVSKSSACRIVQGISAAIAKLYNKYVVLDQKNDINFFMIAQFPRVIGAIDCTHVRVQSPNHLFGDEFKNREGYFSLNVQAVCNADLRLINVVARWPGSIGDDTVFDKSVLKAECERGAFGNRWLLGDTAYPSRVYLLTPLTNPATPNEIKYNEAHFKTWNTIQKTIGLWKRRFPVIGMTLRLRLNNIKNVIISTAVLHNISINNNLEDIEPEIKLPQDIPQNIVAPQNKEVQDFEQRADLIENYFGD